MTRSRLRLPPPFILLLLAFLLLPAGTSAQTVVIPLFSSHKTVTDGTAISGTSTNGVGISGHSVNSSGVLGVSEGTTHNTNNAGVYGKGDDTYGGIFKSEHYRGLYASGGDYYYAAYFDSGSEDNPGIYVNGTVQTGDLSVHGDITATGSKAGYVVDIGVNDGDTDLEAGDVVVVTGAAKPLLGRIPLVRVRKSATAASTAVIGVVDRLFIPPLAAKPPAGADKAPTAPDAGTPPADRETAIGPGKYLSFVTLGSFRVIKADATSGPIDPGDLLVSSATPGHAMASAAPATGTVIGKALGRLDSSTGLIPVLVTLH